MNNFISQLSGKKLLEYYLLSLIIVLGLVFRLYKVYNPIADWHSWRQSDTAAVTRIYADEGLNLLFPKYYDISSIQTGHFNPQGLRFVEFPVFNAIHYAFFTNFGYFNLDTWGRLISTIAALFCGMALYALGKYFAGSLAGLLAATFYLFNPFNVYFTRTVLPDPLATSFVTIALLFFVYYYHTEKKIHLFLFSLLFSLAMLTKPFAIFYGLPVAYLTIKKFGTKGVFKNIPLLLALDIVLIPFLLWRIWIFDRVVGIPPMKWAFNGDSIRFKPSFWRWIFAQRIGQMIMGVWGVVLLAFGFLKKHKNFFAIYYFVASIVYVSVIATANVRHDYYQTFIIPSLALLAALGSINLFKLSANKFLASILFLFSIFMMFGVSFYEVRDFYRINHPEIIIAGQAIDKLTPKDALVIAPYNGDSAFLYQTHRKGWPIVDESIEGMIAKGADYYVSVNNDTDTNKFKSMFEIVEETDQYIILKLHQ